uniref:Macro domain-containing protein n=1 Tax=Phaeomonas parva TaxID=124430 RepID=A0A7S1UKE1_9STRA|mmetsp:Transcript_9465/g.27848  ORF Transcript_9465/g.27848 Transcript_9465/m.27848 type:complete len:670 (+) Transcript_9465:288-2297(+)|eukprot:CAMPEP_0118865246 /NCGR_PEP_ID=MMETSP1163-20130328/9563_1 /TAXON_ID=124430 /ORGANISM="Phaeomonas parva, Strain CCMP2877" /LENGTH=669 /DNA_ID=CAMNT_0006799455 /DNA_START=231 /DNA_END=2240 /DNA_ORIENTATION=+
MPPQGVATHAGDASRSRRRPRKPGSPSVLVRRASMLLPPIWRAQLSAHGNSHRRVSRELLGDVLIANDHPVSSELCEVIDELLAAEAVEPVELLGAHARQAQWGHAGATRVGVWRGDITTLRVDAIVNAANDAGLGCFQPEHRCIDNVIHRAAGPRLRESCRKAMQERRSRLSAGTAPIVTPGHALPARHVLHVTGPQVRSGSEPTAEQSAQLAAAYRNCLGAAKARGIRSIAFPCLSTGLFGFPQQLAAELALRTVRDWLCLDANAGAMDAVVFNVFTPKDAELYTTMAPHVFSASQAEPLPALPAKVGDLAVAPALRRAAEFLAEADAVIVSAGAGLSVAAGTNVYGSKRDFEAAYPDMVRRWGIRTAYECMGLFYRDDIPNEAKWGYQARHMNNMGFSFPPSGGYGLVKDILAATVGEEYFVHTSNVDDCFPRSGFNPERLYTPQGSWTFYQCMRPCRSDSVFPSWRMLDEVVPQVDPESGELPPGAVPRCPNCGGLTFGNVRGGSWFLHKEYEEQQDRMVAWVDELVASDKKVVVLEIGAGFNTPTVTRFPMESIVRELGERGVLIRINPAEAEVPGDINAISIPRGWDALRPISEGIEEIRVSAEPARADWALQAHAQQQHLGRHHSSDMWRVFKARYGHFDWRIFLRQLRAEDDDDEEERMNL